MKEDSSHFTNPLSPFSKGRKLEISLLQREICEKTPGFPEWTGGCRKNCRAATFFRLNDKD
jgi:hypothetical protein